MKFDRKPARPVRRPKPTGFDIANVALALVQTALMVAEIVRK